LLWVEPCPHIKKDNGGVLTPGPQNVTLFRDRVFTEALGQVLTQYGWCPYLSKWENCIEGRQCKDLESRSPYTSLGERPGDRFSLMATDRTNPADTLISDSRRQD